MGTCGRESGLNMVLLSLQRQDSRSCLGRCAGWVGVVVGEEN
jgi:hypothetical protein